MKATRFGGRITVIAATALSLCLLSALMPWFSVRTEHMEYYVLYLDRPEGMMGGSYETYAPIDSVIERTMGLLLLLVPLTLVFVSLVLMDRRTMSLIWGWGIVAVYAGTLAYFALTIGGAVSNSGLQPDVNGFAGSVADGGITWSWGPGKGWFLMLIAAAIQAFAAAIRTYVVDRRLPAAKEHGELSGV